MLLLRLPIPWQTAAAGLQLPISSTLMKIGSGLDIDEPPPSSPKDGVSRRWIRVSGKVTAKTSKFCYVKMEGIRPCALVARIGDQAIEDHDF